MKKNPGRKQRRYLDRQMKRYYGKERHEKNCHRIKSIAGMLRREGK